MWVDVSNSEFTRSDFEMDKIYQKKNVFYNCRLRIVKYPLDDHFTIYQHSFLVILFKITSVSESNFKPRYPILYKIINNFLGLKVVKTKTIYLYSYESFKKRFNIRDIVDFRNEKISKVLR